MARYLFGGQLGNFAYAEVDDIDQNNAASTVNDISQYTGGAVIQLYNAESAGVEYTDITLDREGTNPITTLLSSDGLDGRSIGQIPPFYGPDGVTTMWASADGGPRGLMVTGDAADILTDIGQIWPMVSTSGATVVGVGGHRTYNDTTSQLLVFAVRASVMTAPTGASIKIDVNKNGTTIYPDQANRPEIAIGDNTSGKVLVVDSVILDPGDYLTYDVDQVGSIIAGAELSIQPVVARVVT